MKKICYIFFGIQLCIFISGCNIQSLFSSKSTDNPTEETVSTKKQESKLIGKVKSLFEKKSINNNKEEEKIDQKQQPNLIEKAKSLLEKPKINPQELTYSKNVTPPEIIYKKGAAWLVHRDTVNMIIIKMHLSEGRSYGKYYFAYLSIENFNEKSIDFNPDNIRAEILTKKLIIEDREPLSFYRYMKKVKRSQNWQQVASGIASGLNAASAGYSYATTQSSGSNYTNNSTYNRSNINTNTNQTKSGIEGGIMGKIPYVKLGYNETNTQTNTNKKSSSFSNQSSINSQSTTTQMYSGANAYAARENERIKNQQLVQGHYQLRETIQQGYLQRHTLEPYTSITGNINVKFKKGTMFKLIVPVNNIEYEFICDTHYGQKKSRKK